MGEPFGRFCHAETLSSYALDGRDARHTGTEAG